jgi:ABC-2 type transport system permease protein
MYRRVLALIRKEFLAILQDNKSRLVLIAPPIIQLFIFAFAATLDVLNVSIGILNRDSGKPAYELTQRFQGSPIFTNVIYLKSEKEIQELIDTQKVMMVLHIDEEFSRRILSNDTTEVQLILDGRKSNSSQIVQGYAYQIIEQFNYDINQQLNLPLPTTKLVPRNWFNPNLIYSWFTVPGLVCILTMMISLVLTALSIARERELGTFEQLLVSPLRPIDILIGKTIPAIVLGMLEGTLILIAAIFAFQIPFTGSLLALYLAMIIFVCSIVGIGIFLSSISKTQQQALLAVFVFMSPAVILSGFATPIENMPIFVQHCTLINPLRYFLVIVRGIFLKDLPLSLVLQNTYPIAIIAFFTLTASIWFFRRRLE